MVKNNLVAIYDMKNTYDLVRTLERDMKQLHYFLHPNSYFLIHKLDNRIC